MPRGKAAARVGAACRGHHTVVQFGPGRCPWPSRRRRLFSGRQARGAVLPPAERVAQQGNGRGGERLSGQTFARVTWPSSNAQESCAPLPPLCKSGFIAIATKSPSSTCMVAAMKQRQNARRGTGMPKSARGVTKGSATGQRMRRRRRRAGCGGRWLMIRLSPATRRSVRSSARRRRRRLVGGS